MDEEMNSILKNDTWELIKLPLEKKTIDYQWLYRTRYHVNGSIRRHKAHTKHIKVHHHFIHEHVQEGESDLVYKLTKDQVADLFTKALDKPKFERPQHNLGVKINQLVIKREC